MSPTKKPSSKKVGAAAAGETHDALTLEIERADSLTGLLAERLEALSEGEGPHECYALSLIALGVCDRLQLILDKAKELHKLTSKGGA